MQTHLSPPKTYLGDGVYAACDGYAFVLTTENGIDITNTVVLEPAVYLALVAFVNACGSATRVHRAMLQLVRQAEMQRSA